MDESSELEQSTSAQNDPKTKVQEEDDVPKPQFKCHNCDLNEEYDYFGKRPPFASRIQFNENCYVMKDPFSPAPEQEKTTNSEYFVTLGADCVKCSRPICRGQECSFYYSKSYCLSCAGGVLSSFPLEVQSKIRKQIANSRTK
ncbi:hypothetical protein HA402_000170 [Bradysia odoriphaga]|nr:hypothetical protein HA402_000170 [Bradysia odoriphaga]